MTPEQIAEVGPRLLEFTSGMLGGLARSDQRAVGELYVRGLLTDGQRKSMQPMAERLGVDHQRLQQFITSSTWDYVAVRRNVARWFAASQPVEALVIDDTGFAKDGTASPCVARQYSGTLGKVGNCQIGVSVHLVNERASCAADWRLFCPQSWDDAALDDPVAAARAARRRERAGIPDAVRHAEKWRLALEINLTGYFLVAREAARIMRAQGDGGAMIILSSKSGLDASRANSAYNATKAGELHLMRGWALELGGDGIRVNALAPGNVFEGSKIWNPEYIKAAARKKGIKPEEVIPHYVSLTALKRDIKRSDIAAAAVFLCSDAARCITGQTLVVDSGQVMVR